MRHVPHARRGAGNRATGHDEAVRMPDGRPRNAYAVPVGRREAAVASPTSVSGRSRYVYA